MYVQTLHIYNLRCFVKQVIPLCYPGCPTEKPVPLDNVTLLVGNNGAGKTTILKACALATLSPVLMQSGLVPYHLVRRPIERRTSKTKPYEALVKANALLHEQDVGRGASDKPEDLLTRLQPRGDSNYDVLINSRVPGWQRERLGLPGSGRIGHRNDGRKRAYGRGRPRDDAGRRVDRIPALRDPSSNVNARPFGSSMSVACTAYVHCSPTKIGPFGSLVIRGGVLPLTTGSRNR